MNEIYRFMPLLSADFDESIDVRNNNTEGAGNSYRDQAQIFQLPSEMILSILEFLDAKTLCRFAQVCTTARKFAGYEFLWIKLINRDFHNFSMNERTNTFSIQIFCFAISLSSPPSTQKKRYISYVKAAKESIPAQNENSKVLNYYAYGEYYLPY